MPRYIDAEPLPHGQFWDNCTDTEKAKILSWILSQPTVDAVKVVRCEWCKHRQNKYGICEKFRQRYPFYPEDDFYCGFGEIEEVEDNDGK